MGKRAIWIAWLCVVVAIGSFLGFRLWASEDRSLFLVGATTSGHHQIELACEACHTSPFGGGEVLQDACVGCHAKELKEADDSHPKSKFTDPRNADRVAALDARNCVACHVEHRPEHTRAMGVTLPDDFCFQCHQQIAEERPSHEGMGFGTCASAGCHNFHDNRSLYEKYLLTHAAQPDLLENARVLLRTRPDLVAKLEGRKPLHATEQDAPKAVETSPAVLDEWAHSGHAAAGVNCSGCHAPQGADWQNQPGEQVCRECHASQVEGFLTGKHGMRLPQGLSPMRTEFARLPMQPESAGQDIGCVSCHESHAFDTQKAAVDACLGCHADDHSIAFQDSPHFTLWQRELAGEAPPGSGVSCATCHLPREEHQRQGRSVTVVQHNQNANLRPNEKMIRSVCQSCHGLAFSIDALADPELIRANFRGRAAAHVPSIDMALQRSSPEQGTVEAKPQEVRVRR